MGIFKLGKLEFPVKYADISAGYSEPKANKRAGSGVEEEEFCWYIDIGAEYGDFVYELDEEDLTKARSSSMNPWRRGCTTTTDLS